MLLASPAHAVTVQIDYTYDAAANGGTGFFGVPGSAARNVMQAAADYFSAVLTDTLSAITSSGINAFNAVFTDPATLTGRTLNSYSVASDTIVVFAGGNSTLGSSTLGIGGPGGYTASGTGAFLNAVRLRGETAETQGSTATEFAPWGGSIAFSTAVNWYFDSDVTTTEAFAGFDFYSVALHELAHVLGFGTADSWANWLSGGIFTGTVSVATNGGGVAVNSGQDHWAAGTTSTVGGQVQETAMDPDIAAGQRKRMTALDVAGLDDLGWDIASQATTTSRQVPAIPDWMALMLALTLIAITVARRPGGWRPGDRERPVRASHVGRSRLGIHQRPAVVGRAPTLG
jgi:hypothetical protein